MKAAISVRDKNKPIGVAEWQTKLVASLPTMEEIEAELSLGWGKQGKAKLKGVGYGG